MARNELVASEIKSIDDTSDEISITVDKQVVIMTDDNINEQAIKDWVNHSDFIIMMTYNLKGKAVNAQKIIDITNTLNKPMVVIASRNPYDIGYLEGVKANLAVYGVTGFDVTNANRNSLEANIRAGIRTLFNDPNTGTPLNNPSGELPVDIYAEKTGKVIYPYGHGLKYSYVSNPFM